MYPGGKTGHEREAIKPREMSKLRRLITRKGSKKEAAHALRVHRNTIPRMLTEQRCSYATLQRLKKLNLKKA